MPFELLLGTRRGPAPAPPPLPQELLQEIFKHAIPLSFSLNPLLDKDEGPDNWKKNYAWIDSMKMKLSISYVCKLWNLAAKPFLYRDIAFQTHLQPPCFIRTVEQRPEYSCWVKTLNIYVMRYSISGRDSYYEKLGRNVERILFQCPNLIGLGLMSTPSYVIYLEWDTKLLPPITHLSVKINHPNELKTIEMFQQHLISLSISIDQSYALIHRPISLPLLKTLSISITHEVFLRLGWQIAEGIKVILNGIPTGQLENLVYECLETPVVVAGHSLPRFLLYPPYGVGPSLRSLSLSISTHSIQHFTWQHLQTILDACPKLEHLAMNPTPSTLHYAHHPNLKSLDLGTPFHFIKFMLGKDDRKYQDLPSFPSLQRRRLITLRRSETRFFLPISLSLPLEQIHSDCDTFRMNFQQVRLRHRRGEVSIAGKASGLYPVPRNPAIDAAFWEFIAAIVLFGSMGTIWWKLMVWIDSFH